MKVVLKAASTVELWETEMVERMVCGWAVERVGSLVA
jgi:hypothetical protein